MSEPSLRFEIELAAQGRAEDPAFDVPGQGVEQVLRSLIDEEIGAWRVMPRGAVVSSIS